MRLILFSGKGGVGKTTISAATALYAASLGRRSLVVSTDLAHNLADVLEATPGRKLWRIEEKAWAMEVDVLSELSKVWAELKDYLTELLSYFGFSTLMAEEAMLLPGVSEFFSLSAVFEAAETGDYDLVAVDCGPTADTMRMLGFADSAPEKIHKFLRLQRTVVSMLRPFQRGVEVPLPREAALDQLGPLADRADRIRRMLADKGTTSARLVMNPDALSMAETGRLYTYLSLFGLDVDYLVINKLLPKDCRAGSLEALRRTQLERLHDIGSSFPLETATVEFSGEEPRGAKALREIGKMVYGERDPLAHFGGQSNMEYGRDEKGARVLRVPLPISDKSGLKVRQQGPQVILGIGSYIRMLTLPDGLANAQIEKASVEPGMVTLTFAAN